MSKNIGNLVTKDNIWNDHSRFHVPVLAKLTKFARRQESTGTGPDGMPAHRNTTAEEL